MLESNSTVYGNISTPIEVAVNVWEIIIDYYPESRNIIPYKFKSKEEADGFVKEWKKNEHNRKSRKTKIN